jgi:membrane protein
MRIPGVSWISAKVGAARERWRWLDFAASVFRKGGRDGVGRLAAVVAYYAFFSLFPLLMVLVFVLGTLLDGSLRDDIMDSALMNFPVIGTQISKDGGQLEGQGLALLIGLATALWAGTHAFDAFDHAIHTVWDGPRAKRSMIRRRLSALFQLGVLGGALVATTAATVLLNSVVSVPGMAVPAKVLVSVVLNTLFGLVMFRVVGGSERTWRDHLPGSIVAGVGLTLLQTLGQYYLQRLVSGASDTYGTFATVIGLLSWLHLLASLLIWSAEISVVAWLRRTRADGLREARRARSRRRPGEPATD